MTEVQFAKQFLTTLDSKPTKYQQDHVFDTQTFQIRVPYTLPKLSHPPHPLPTKTHAATTSASGAGSIASTIDITLKSSRNPTFTLHLPSLPTSTPISTLRAQVQSLLSQSQPTPIPAEKIKILQNKKPIPASKSTVSDILTGTNDSKSNVEFGVMVLGGAADPTPTTQTLNLTNEIEPSPQEVGPESEKAAADTMSIDNGAEKGQRPENTRSPEPVQPGEISGLDVLKTKEFWDDLQGFLEQRLRSSEVAQTLRGVFEKALE